MALKRRRDDKTWKDFFRFYLITITSGLLCLSLFVTSEPICYTQTSLDESNRYFKTVDCDGTDTICKRFNSREEVNVFDILNSECGYPEDYQLTTEKKEAIKCHEVDLPTIEAGFFNCSGYSVGDKCNLTCDNGYFPCSSNEIVCAENGDSEVANWTGGNFQCSECNKWNRWNGSEYKFIDTNQSWDASRQLCESDSAHLVTIQDGEENDFILKVVNHCSPTPYIWIGLNDIKKEGEWEWTDGSVATYRNWYETIPEGEETEDCADIYYLDGEWERSFCNYLSPSVCERNIPP